MQPGETILAAEELLSAYRELLLVDPFYKIAVDTQDGDFVSECRQDSGALAWRICLNPARHGDILDVQYSIVDGLLRIGFAGLDRAAKKEQPYVEARDEVLVRLTTVLCSLLQMGSDKGTESAEENENVPT